MKNLPIFLLAMTLCISCSHQIQKPEKLEIRNTIGIVLHHKKVLTVDTKSAGPICFYYFDAKKVPPNRKFYLQATDEAQPNYPPLELLSDGYGCLRLASDQSIRLRDHLHAMQFLLPGDIQTVWLVSEDKHHVIKTQFVPYPLEAFGSDGAQISLLRLTKDGSQARCTGNYFNNNEKLKIVSASSNKQVLELVQCYNGNFTIDLAVPDPKKFGDTITLKITRENGELLTLTYPFGRESFNKDLLLGNFNKLTEEEYDKVTDALQCYYKGTSPEALI